MLRFEVRKGSAVLTPIRECGRAFSIAVLPMVDVRAIEFNEALSHLQGLIDAELQIIINFYGTFCGCYLTGRLVKVTTLAPGDAAVNLVIGDRNGIHIDPAEVVEILLAGDLDDVGSLSFHLPGEIAIQIERTRSA